ncbi:UbiA family prenyltransferase [Crossiella cryophila]|uniref:4-hydroxybenzoate polyprenyltransferase/geranylgeranylglycerol-phosphate geranylgeranyltransferase n=1 Tax=Crossiella cryophila TaxID=43355 RepID=A0A7W7FYB7_9PSEU|nr:UbiA family prenyltransferase [Crossiella cryophila]MBB4679884.1 4-hydroxybenzoate polyprenyltransferase/geranylgeranylglycerol-phosphate geranylgeranyltransferase [Crossiella cryophila]
MNARRVLLAHLEICRPDSMFYAGLVGLAGAVLAARLGQTDPDTWRLFAAWAAPTCGWIASLYGGDYFDRELDATAKPHRPIPSGRMSPRTAFTGMVLTIVLGLVFAIVLNPLNLVLGAIAVVSGISYSRTFKARGIAGNLMRGVPTALAFLVGTTASTAIPPWELLPLALAFWLHDSASNLVGALCDTDSDREGGYRTYPVRHGDAASLRMLTVLNGLWIALAVGWPLLLADRLDLGWLWPFLALALPLCALCQLRLTRAPRPIPRLAALRAHEILVGERLVLATGFIAVSGRPGLAVAVLAPAVVLTGVARAFMRRRDHPSLRR